MAPKKKVESLGRTRWEAQLEQEYSMRTDILHKLKKRAEQLQRDNEFLQNEACQTQRESQEYMMFVSRQTQKRQSIMDTQRDQRQQELQELKRQKLETVKKYEEQANILKQKILEKENELALLNLEIAKLGEIKSLQQQQQGCIAELEQEIAATCLLHAKSLQDLKSGFFVEKENYKTQTKHKAQIHNLHMKASICLQSLIHEVYQDNQQLCEELLQLIQRTHTLRSRRMKLQTQYRELLLERSCSTSAKTQRVEIHTEDLHS